MNLSDLNLRHLKYYLDSVTQKSMNAAALTNHVSSSTISHGIRKIEEIIGAVLIEDRSPIKLTAEGSIIYKTAKDVFDSLENMNLQLENLRHGFKGDLEIVSTNSLCLYWLPKYMTEFEKSFPHINIKFHRGNYLEICSKIREGEAEIALTAMGPQSKLFDEFDYATIAAGNFFLYSKDSDEIKDDDTLLIDHADIDIFTYNQQLMHMNPELKNLKSRELPSWSMIGAYIEAGAGVGMLPEFIGSHMGLQKIRSYPKDKLPSFEIRALWKKLKVKSKLASSLLEFLEKNPSNSKT